MPFQRTFLAATDRVVNQHIAASEGPLWDFFTFAVLMWATAC